MCFWLRNERFCIDNGIMIAQAGLLAYETGFRTAAGGEYLYTGGSGLMRSS